MEFPALLRKQIEELYEGVKQSELAQDSKQLSQNYRTNKFGGVRLLQTQREALAYAAVRMPATFGAVSTAFEKVLEVYPFSPLTMLDVGAGTGTCGWAADCFFNLEKLVCLEREDVMLSLGKQLMEKADSDVLRRAQWQKFDLLQENILPQADLVTTSYMLNELPVQDRENAIMKLWQSTKQVLLIIEPGTPVAFENLLKLRDILIQSGAYVIAPCSHQSGCPLEKESWCHFSARIARSRLHKQLKSAEMGYEDEKFCYMAFSRQPVFFSYERILRDPKVTKAEIACEVCRANAQKETIKISVRDKNMYKKAKKLRWGDILA